jgi:GNAT superfamily N-acetyltransferase
MYEIHSASLRDIPALIGLMAEFYGESGFPLPEANARAAFAALLSDPRLGGGWIAREDDAALGHVVLTVGFSMEYGALRGFVDDLFVRPQARGRGVAGALIDAVVADCRARDVRALLVEVGPDNGPGRRVYEKAGLVETGHLLLARPLAPPLHI